MMSLSCRVEIRREWIEDSGVVGSVAWTIDKVEGIEITGDGDSLQDTCTIKLPKNARWGVSGSEIPVRRGDMVRVWLGYDGEIKLRFLGYVKDVSAKTPTVITCEDEMFRLRQRAAKRHSYPSVTLSELLDDQLEGLDIVRYARESEEQVHLGALRVEATTVAGLLSELKKNYGITSCFALVDDVPTLFCYTILPQLRRNAGKFEEGVNIIDNSLEYRRSEDVEVKVHGISIQEDNSRIEYSEGEGEERTMYRYGLSMEELRVAVKNELKREKWSGLQGSFTTFGKPRIEKMDVLDLYAGGTKGRYRVKGVNVSFGKGGYRQEVQLRERVAEL